MKKKSRVWNQPSKRQAEVLEFVTKFRREKRYSPSLGEIAYSFGVSIPTIHQHVSSLRKKNLIISQKGKKRSIQILDNHKEDAVEIPLLGVIAAGDPIEAIEESKTISVPKSQLSKTGEHFALRVSGESMIDEGIFDGDTVIIKRQSTAEDGETVVALLNGNEVTLKKIYKEKTKFRLQPANPKLKPIYTKELQIQGKVVSVIRTFEELKNKTIVGKRIAQEKIKLTTKNILKEWINTIQNMDCLVGLEQIPDSSINLIITDPPYGISRELNCKGQRLGTTAKLNFNFGEWDKFNENWFEVALKKTRGWIMTFCGKKDVGYFIEKLEKSKFVGIDVIVWQKPDPVPLNAKSRFLNAWEAIVVGKKPGATWNSDYEHNIIKVQAPKGKNRIHPTQKPVSLIKRLIDLTTKKGELILDPFTGIVTTAIACIEA